MENINEIFVYENWKAAAPSLIGTLYVDGGIEYAEEWLTNLSNNANLDPDLGLFKGRQYAPADKSMFGMFKE